MRRCGYDSWCLYARGGGGNFTLNLFQGNSDSVWVERRLTQLGLKIALGGKNGFKIQNVENCKKINL